MGDIGVTEGVPVEVEEGMWHVEVPLEGGILIGGTSILVEGTTSLIEVRELGSRVEEGVLKKHHGDSKVSLVRIGYTASTNTFIDKRPRYYEDARPQGVASQLSYEENEEELVIKRSQVPVLSVDKQGLMTILCKPIEESDAKAISISLKPLNIYVDVREDEEWWIRSRKDESYEEMVLPNDQDETELTGPRTSFEQAQARHSTLLTLLQVGVLFTDLKDEDTKDKAFSTGQPSQSAIIELTAICNNNQWGAPQYQEVFWGREALIGFKVRIPKFALVFEVPGEAAFSKNRSVAKNAAAMSTLLLLKKLKTELNAMKV